MRTAATSTGSRRSSRSSSPTSGRCRASSGCATASGRTSTATARRTRRGDRRRRARRASTRRTSRSSSPSARSRSPARAGARRTPAASPTAGWRSSTARSSAASRSPRTSTPSAPRRRYERGLLTVVLPLAEQPRTGRVTIALGDRRSARERARARRRRHSDDSEVEVPSTLPVLPLKETVVFPQSMTPLAIGQERSIKLVDDVVDGDRMLALVTVQQRGRRRSPAADDLYEVGTAAVVHKLIRVPDGTLRILVQGLRRIKLERRVQRRARTSSASSPRCRTSSSESKEVEALTRNVQNLFARIIALVPYLPEELQLAAANVDDPSALSHLVASTMRLKTEEKQELLETADVAERLREIYRDPQPRARGDRARLEDPVAGPVRDGEGPARVLPAPAAEGDPGGARRGRRRSRPRSTELRAQARRARAARGRAQGGRARALAAREAAARPPPSTA